MENLRVTAIQSYLHWQDVSANLVHFTHLLKSIVATDLIVLPEMFSTGFTMEPKSFAEVEQGKSFQWMRDISKIYDCAIVGSISTQTQSGQYVNRCYFMKPDGSYEYYDKRHLFRMGNEHLHYEAGKQKKIVDYKGWKILLQVCYDLRFPVFTKNRFDHVNHTWDYDVILYPANWPERRSYAWSSLLIARAIENQAYVIGVNRVKEDGKQINHSGDSVILNYLGEPVASAQKCEEEILQAELDASALLSYRTGFPVGLDADNFQLETN
jgi:omega-amidase